MQCDWELRVFRGCLVRNLSNSEEESLKFGFNVVRLGLVW